MYDPYNIPNPPMLHAPNPPPVNPPPYPGPRGKKKHRRLLFPHACLFSSASELFRRVGKVSRRKGEKRQVFEANVSPEHRDGFVSLCL